MADNDPDDLSGLPLEPTPEQLPAAYALVRRKLARANRSRTALKSHDDYRGSLFGDVRAELKQIEASFREQASGRAAVHELNQRVLEIVRSLEDPLDAMVTIVEEKDKGGLTGWTDRFARLLPLVLQLRQAKAAARRLLGRTGHLPVLPPVEESQPEQDGGQVPEPNPTADSAVEPDSSQPEAHQPPQHVQPGPIEAVQTLLPIQVEPTAPPQLETPPGSPSASPETAPTTSPEATSEARLRKGYGPLLLQFTGASYGVLLLPSANQRPPDGLILQEDNPWLPGHPVLIPQDHDDPELAAIDAGFLAIEQEASLVAELQPWLNRKLLPFTLDPILQLPRLVHNAAIGAISHVLVRASRADVFQEHFGGTRFDVDSDLWLGFELDPEEAERFWRGLDQEPGRIRELAPRLATRGGVALVDRRGFLATGLGLPLLTAPLACDMERVQLQLASGIVLDYARSPQDKDTAERQLWQPSPADRRRVELPEGTACFKAWLADGSSLQRMIQLRALPEQVHFQRAQPLAYREDWGLALGPLELPQVAFTTTTPSAAALQWARQRLNQGDANVDAVFEQQMLESLSGLFQRRSSLRIKDFLRLYTDLLRTPEKWPGFPKSILRGWCEGGWLEEGVELRGGRWRLQPVDPRLVRLPGGGLQLVGLLSARRLVAVLATARELGLTIRSVSPTCAAMPRGWRFFGAVDQLGSASGLPVVTTSDWVPDPTDYSWIIPISHASDTPPWPVGSGTRLLTRKICQPRLIIDSTDNSKTREIHWKPVKPLPERYRASIHLRIEEQISTYGKRRWHSHDPVQDVIFTSCHRNRVALHALMVATDGLWPFGFTDSDIGRIDRLYDCEAYLPLPLARWAALTGRAMPGPTRHRPGDHTYRYHVSAALRSHQIRTSFLPLTSTP
jgi:hypothetical protein